MDNEKEAKQEITDSFEEISATTEGSSNPASSARTIELIQTASGFISHVIEKKQGTPNELRLVASILKAAADNWNHSGSL
ncbi:MULTISPECIES: hypothetical protein [Paenibacillus]|uniref:hypothetical protein n=1 Tax=Paenibacillus TaxID=44249 RepID=UPI0022B89C8F|nr:hypothetical protein [Paenibacillus caseinilyticus]MCZ8520161.1 hypothetical protein [Paenibacillus caseinilyticus]